MSGGCVEWAEKSPTTAVWSRQDICDAVEPEEPVGVTLKMFDQAVSNDNFPVEFSTIVMYEKTISIRYSPASGGPVVIKSKAISTGTISLLGGDTINLHMRTANASVLGMPTETEKLTMKTKAVSSETISLLGGDVLNLHMRGA